MPLSYKYDLSMMIDDVLGLVEELIARERGSREIHWPSNTFACSWWVEWAEGEVSINSEWRSVVGNVEGVLALKPKIVMKSADFIAEWKKPLERILFALTSAGYGDGFPNMERLRVAIESIPHPGVLYAD
ncbi:MAG: hypothetical protein QM784_40250 [Polyangiaceae bacterium]